MSNGTREGWLTREQVEEIETATKDAVRSGNIIEMVDHQEVLALTRMALAALDARENPLVLETAFKMVQDAHAKPKPEATTELCAKCGEPESRSWHHNPADWEGRETHPFTPAPKEQRP